MAGVGAGLCQGAENAESRVAQSPFLIRHWTSEHGLAQNKVSCLKKTRDGYLWVGTHFGLARFDGTHFTTFSGSNASGMTNDTINALAEDKEGNLWIGTDHGLFSYQQHGFRAAPAQSRLQGKRILAMTSARYGGLWVRTDDGLAKLTNGVLSRFWNVDPKEQHCAIVESPDGSMQLFTKKSWLTLPDAGGELRTNWVASDPDMYCRAAWPAAQPATAWIGTKTGLYLCSNDVCQPQGWASNVVDNVFCDRMGKLWLSVGAELRRWDGARSEAVALELDQAGEPKVCFEEDAEGSVWIGGSEGLFQVREPLVTTFDTNNGLLDNKTWSICQATDGTIWVGGERGLSLITESGKAAPWGPGEQTERCVWPRPQGGIWTSRTFAGLYEVQNWPPAQQVAPAALFPGSITCLWDDGADRLFVGTERQLLVFNDTAPGPWTSPSTNYDVRDVRSILKDHHGNLWLGTGNYGVVRIAQEKPDYYTAQANGLSDNRVLSMVEDADGAIWLATENGLTRCMGGAFFAFTRQQGLLENLVTCVLDDGAGFLWLSGNQGLYRISREQLKTVAQHRAAEVQPFVIGTADGMKSAESNGEKQPSGWKARDGRLWFPTMRGVVVVDPKAVPGRPLPPRVILEQVKSDGEVIFGDADPEETNSRLAANPQPRSKSATDTIRIRPGAGRLEFHFGCTSLVAAERNRFRYKLGGIDPDWRVPTADRVANYSLPPGDYQFEVAAADYHNVWSAAVPFRFYLEPHFWQTRTFYVGCATSLFLVAAAIQAYRLRWQRRLLKLEEQKSIATERARIARDLHDDLGTALTGLALQLDVAGHEAKASGWLAERLSQAARHTRDLAERMREVVWTVNPGCDNVSSLADFLEQQVSQFLRADSMQVRLDFPENIPDLPLGGAVRHHLALSVREALTNVVRHARASQVSVNLAIEGQHVIIEVKDNGCGLQQSGHQGNGLRNMRSRLEQINGSFDCQSEPGRGTTITFRVPLSEHQSNKRPNHEQN